MRKFLFLLIFILNLNTAAFSKNDLYEKIDLFGEVLENIKKDYVDEVCLLYTSPSPRDAHESRMPSSA